MRPVGFGLNAPRYEIHLQRTRPTLAGYLATSGAVREGGIRPGNLINSISFSLTPSFPKRVCVEEVWKDSHNFFGKNLHLKKLYICLHSLHSILARPGTDLGTCGRLRACVRDRVLPGPDGISGCPIAGAQTTFRRPPVKGSLTRKRHNQIRSYGTIVVL